ncbi:thioesterase family protein [Mesoaciditoga lauensis]|uniref:thioesterase family protein n=1 Tax=Mesoaciditoga lauensis TaxID=1495039 RepID=UPI00056C7938|nr:hotdog domain-containing protein [Mesoaciditoga lauensis]
MILEKVVTPKDCATNLKSGEVEVLSTPTVLAWMEEASAELSKKILNEDETTVGAHVELDHLAPAFIGDKVIIESSLVEKGKKKLSFNITAKKGETILAKAFHVRVIVNKRKFSK